MITDQELARYIISTIKSHMTDISPEEFDVTPLKLQKLLYYCQGYSLALTGKTAFSEKVEAWDNGPVVESVYQEYKKYSGGIIPIGSIKPAEALNDTLKSIVDLVLADKGKYSGYTLAKATHRETPWRKNYRGACGGVYMNAEISICDMRDYFARELSRREEDYEGEDYAWKSIAEPVSISELEAAIEEL